MKALLQRVKKCTVSVGNNYQTEIGQGLLVLLGVEKNDSEENAQAITRKIADLRIFEDNDEKMNLSVKDIQGEIMVVSQFTLAGDTSHGNRPGFSNAAAPQKAKELYEFVVKLFKNMGLSVKTGVFQAHMEVALINDGPATFLLEK